MVTSNAIKKCSLQNFLIKIRNNIENLTNDICICTKMEIMWCDTRYGSHQNRLSKWLCSYWCIGCVKHRLVRLNILSSIIISLMSLLSFLKIEKSSKYGEYLQNKSCSWITVSLFLSILTFLTVECEMPECSEIWTLKWLTAIGGIAATALLFF